jgi:Zn-dependent protease
MFRSWRLGRVLGFPVEINLSFILLLAVVLVAWGGLAGVIGVLIAFASVLLHELGHAVVARQLGVHVAGIELSFFGGAAKMAELPRRPKHEIAIAAAGPAVSLMLGGLGLGLGLAVGSPFIALVGWINFIIAGFNLIPALPMDGGRILRALLAQRMGFLRATEAATIVARVFTVAFGVIGLAFGMYQLAILAPFLWLMTSAEQRAAREWSGDDGSSSRFERAFAHDPFRRGGGIQRRYTVARRPDGRVVIETWDV